MNDTKKAVAIVTSAAVAVAALYLRASREATLSRFTDLDPKIAKKAYRVVARGCYMGKYGDISNFTTEQMDQLFLQEVARLSTEK